MTNETEAPELKAALEAHGLKTDKPSQLSDAFRLGWNTRADLHDAKDKRIEELEAAIKRQAGAAKTLRNATLAEVQHIRDNERKEYAAIRTLDSERDANAILTDENDALKARITELEAERDRQYDQNCEQIIRIAELEAKLAKAEMFIKEISFRAMSSEHDEDELWLIDKGSLTHSWDVDITKARTTLTELKGTD